MGGSQGLPTMIPKNSSIENCKELQERASKTRTPAPKPKTKSSKLTKIFRSTILALSSPDQETVNLLTESSRPLSTGEIARVYLDPEQSIG